MSKDKDMFKRYSSSHKSLNNYKPNIIESYVISKNDQSKLSKSKLNIFPSKLIIQKEKY